MYSPPLPPVTLGGRGYNYRPHSFGRWGHKQKKGENVKKMRKKGN
jgi:hypothetical protein